jgi:hypothetical protein
MNKTELEKAKAAAEFEFYESIAKLIVDSPAVSLADLRKQHGKATRNHLLPNVDGPEDVPCTSESRKGITGIQNQYFLIQGPSQSPTQKGNDN